MSTTCRPLFPDAGQDSLALRVEHWRRQGFQKVAVGYTAHAAAMLHGLRVRQRRGPVLMEGSLMNLSAGFHRNNALPQQEVHTNRARAVTRQDHKVVTLQGLQGL